MPRIERDEPRQQRRHQQGAVVVHDAEPDMAMRAMLAQPRDGLVADREDPPGIAEQRLAGRLSSTCTVLRWNSSVSSRSSKRLTCMLTADCVRLSFAMRRG
jgi:hypothetical protein